MGSTMTSGGDQREVTLWDRAEGIGGELISRTPLAGSNGLICSSGAEQRSYSYTAAGDLQQQSGTGVQFAWSYGGNAH
jgi:hypothetical protein